MFENVLMLGVEMERIRMFVVVVVETIHVL